MKINLISIVFSFRNEEDVLPELIKRTRDVLKNEQKRGIISKHELIFVNDASTDSSFEILMKQAKDFGDIKIINMSRRFGVTPCVIAGLKNSHGDAVVYMDSDLQDPPEIIPQLIEKWQSEDGVDVVHTVRQSRKGESKIKLFVTRIGYYMINRFSRIQIPIEAGDFKLLSRRAVDHLLLLKENNPYMRGLVAWIGFKQLYVSYNRDPRFAGKTKFHVFGKDVISNFLDSALISFSSAPLKLAIVLGVCAIFIDFLIMGHAFYEKYLGRAIPGWTAIMISLLFLGGVQLLCLGIVGLYLYSIHEQSKMRPHYIIESTYGFSQTN